MSGVAVPRGWWLLWVATWVLASGQVDDSLPCDEADTEVLQVHETLQVRRIALDVRVITAQGDPVLGLKADDFEWLNDGQTHPVDTCLWMSVGADTSTKAEVPFSPDPMDMDDEAFWDDDLSQSTPLITLLVQGDISGMRGSSRLKLLDRTREWVRNLSPNQRVAVVSFTSHLTLHCDFESDLGAIQVAIEDAFFNRSAPAQTANAFPSLARRLDRFQIARIPTIEEALLALGRAFRGLPGPKSLVLAGWGVGEYRRGGVSFSPEYHRAVYELVQSKTTVFVLDFSHADFHTLELGLKQLARDCGGFYAKTWEHPEHAFQRLNAALLGHYRLFIEPPPNLSSWVGSRLRVKNRDVDLLVTPAKFWGR